jgi:hypothetical protein
LPSWRNNIPFWLSFVLFQAGWFLIVMGSQSYLYLAVLPLLGLYLRLESRWHTVSKRQHVARILLALIGFGFDSLIGSFGLISFNGEQYSGFTLAPIWLALLWYWFITTLATCYGWLVNRAYLAILVAAVFGPASYWGASYISAITIIQPMTFTGLSMVFWGCLFAMIFTKKSLTNLYLYHSTSASQ